MKKRIFCLLICFLMMFVTGCGDDAVSSNTSAEIDSLADGTVSSSGSVPNGSSSAVSSIASAASSAVQSASSQSGSTESKPSKPSSSVTSSVNSEPQVEEPQEKKPTHLIMMSDVHLEDYNKWYGLTSPDRMTKMVGDLNNFYQKDPFDHLFILGDTSLDFWENTTYGGSYRREGRSNTKTLVDTYLSKLKAKNHYLIPGNHEQYSNSDWKKITGRDRQYSVVIDGWLFLMLDTFAGELDPDYDHHGIYTGVDIAFVNEEMAKYPNLPVVLCAHYFNIDKESNLFRSLLKSNKRIVCLFEGHDHVDTVEQLPNSLGNKKVFHCGNFSYTSNHDIDKFGSWGWRNVYISEDSIKIDYYTPRNILDGGKKVIPEGVKQTAVEIENPMK